MNPLRPLLLLLAGLVTAAVTAAEPAGPAPASPPEKKYLGILNGRLRQQRPLQEKTVSATSQFSFMLGDWTHRLWIDSPAYAGSSHNTHVEIWCEQGYTFSTNASWEPGKSLERSPILTNFRHGTNILARAQGNSQILLFVTSLASAQRPEERERLAQTFTPAHVAVRTERPPFSLRRDIRQRGNDLEVKYWREVPANPEFSKAKPLLLATLRVNLRGPDGQFKVTYETFSPNSAHKPKAVPVEPQKRIEFTGEWQEITEREWNDARRRALPGIDTLTVSDGRFTMGDDEYVFYNLAFDARPPFDYEEYRALPKSEARTRLSFVR